MNYRPISMVNKEMLFHIFQVLSAIIFLGTTVKSHGCTNYTVLSDATRSLSYYDNSQRKLCDKNLETKWYRFIGQAGNRMQGHCPTAKRYHCQTSFVGWLDGKHPTVVDGEVERKVCFYHHILNDCCFWDSVVKVKNCGGRYYVYKLSAPPKGCSRYCGTGAGK